MRDAPLFAPLEGVLPSEDHQTEQSDSPKRLRVTTASREVPEWTVPRKPSSLRFGSTEEPKPPSPPPQSPPKAEPPVVPAPVVPEGFDCGICCEKMKDPAVGGGWCAQTAWPAPYQRASPAAPAASRIRAHRLLANARALVLGL